MSAKNSYSTNAGIAAVEASKSASLAKSWAKARAEHDRLIGHIESVNINEYAKSDYNEAEVKIQGRKIRIPSRFGPLIEIVADFAGGYMRLQVKGSRRYVGLDGKPANAKSLQEFQRLTHFRIKKWEEM